MRYLPPIQLGEKAYRMLIRDTSVTALARWLLVEDSETVAGVHAAFENDPSLVEWTCVRTGIPNLNAETAFLFWRERPLEYLCWKEGDPWEPESPLPPDAIHQDDPADAIHQDNLEGVPISLPALTDKLRRLRALETRFDETLERAKLDAMAEFAAGAGHEINNPVAVIAGRAQLFLRTETDPKRRHDLALMDAQARRVYEMIADMRLFARPPEPQMRGFDLARLVADTLDELRGEADRRSIGLRQTGKSHLNLTADPDQIAVALRALCKNAFESIQKNGTVEVRLEENGLRAILRVIDDGPGIPDDVRPHIFDPYFSARQAGRGLGLGLSKAWRIVVSNHGGTIEVGKTEDGRTVFSVGLGTGGE